MFDLNCNHFALLSCYESRHVFLIFDEIIIKASDEKAFLSLQKEETVNVDVGGKI